MVRVPDWWWARRPPRPQVQVKLGERKPSELGPRSTARFRGRPVARRRNAHRRRAAANCWPATEGLVLLRGKWVEVDREKLQQALDHWKQVEQEHPDGLGFIEGMRLLAGAELDATTRPSDEVAVVVADHGRRLAAGHARPAARSPKHRSRLPAGRDLQATLRPYQVDGVRWLWFMTELGLGACLADDMGLGKTIQVIDLLLQRKRQRGAQARGAEPARRAGVADRQLAAGAGPLRPDRCGVLRPSRRNATPKTLDRVAADPGARAGGIRPGHHHLRPGAGGKPGSTKVHWSLVVLDEAQAIKNAGSAQTQSVKKLPAAGRIVLDGHAGREPPGRSVVAVRFLLPRPARARPPQFKQFVKRLNKQQDAAGLRRAAAAGAAVHSAAAEDRPDHCPRPARQDRDARRVRACRRSRRPCTSRPSNDLAERLEDAEGIARRGLVLATLMQLKQICNHPGAVPGGAATSRRPTAASSSGWRLLCEPIAERQEKALVFTQFQSLTEPLADFLATRLRPAGAGAARRHAGPQAERAGAAVSRRRRPAVLRHLAQGRRQRAEPDGRVARRSTSIAGGTRPSRTRPPTGPSASARSATCWCTSSSAAARSRSGSTR